MAPITGGTLPVVFEVTLGLEIWSFPFNYLISMYSNDVPLLNSNLLNKITLNNRFKVMELVIFAYWYISLFPGRLGFDGSEAIRIIQRGESTDWWTASFFWFLRILSFDGQSIFLASFATYAFLVFSLKYFVFSLPARLSILRRTYLIMLATPIVSVFGLTVSHDAFQVAGTLILVGTLFRNAGEKSGLKSINPALLVLAYSGLLTTRLGIFIVFFDIFF
jgi:hypothetical protein